MKPIKGTPPKCVSPKKTFKNQFLRDILTGDTDEEVEIIVEIISDEITDASRWSINHWLIFQYDGKIYGVRYSEGATEMQNERPFQYAGEDVEVMEFKEAQKMVTQYVQY